MVIFLIEFSKVLIYFIISASIALLIHFFIKIPNELYRKLLHFILLGSAPVFLYSFGSWQRAVLASLTFMIIIYPVLSAAENLKGYSKILPERDSGEIKKSLLYVFSMFAIVFTISWGIFGVKYIALAVIFGWGFGDAAAALVGKKYGKRYLEGKHIEGRKTVEGSFAMFLVSFITIFIILKINIELTYFEYFIISLITSMVNSFIELNTKKGLDTITCPFSILIVILPLLYFVK